MATWQYSRRVQIRWRALLPAALTGFVGAFAGAWAVTVLSPDFLRRMLPFVLLAVLAYTVAKKELGRHHRPRFAGRAEWLAASVIGLSIGFYDGFFGPGTGSFFVFLFVRWLGYDFLNASASAKLLNVSTNIAALILFGVGWGLSGVCPGPAIAGLGTGNLDMLWVLAGLAILPWLARAAWRRFR